MIKVLLPLAALVLLSSCATGMIGDRSDWRCDGGSAFSARIKTNGSAEVFAGGRVHNLPHVAGDSGARYSDGQVIYWERGGSASLTGAFGGPYENCRR